MGMPSATNYSFGIKDFTPDASLGLSFYLTSQVSNSLKMQTAEGRK
jgi:hypothetical protein